MVHCAGLKAVGEAEVRPLTYYEVNVGGAFALAEVMGEAGVATLVFSSSATVYGQPERLPVTEDAPLAPQSVYGRTKRVVEEFLRDLARANPNWRIAVLRYFNPAGAHPSGLIGEAPSGRPNNLVPLLCRIAAGEFSDLAIYGTDWPTPGHHLPVFVAGINTAILLTSSATMHWALQSIKRGYRPGLQAGLVLTFLMGLTFLLTQITEYARIGFAPRDNAFTSVFFCLTGLHGAHVLVGLTLLAFATTRAFRGHFSPEHHHGVEIPGIYWHFVDVMWIVVYTTVYII